MRVRRPKEKRVNYEQRNLVSGLVPRALYRDATPQDHVTEVRFQPKNAKLSFNIIEL